MVTTDINAVALAEELRERTAMRYMGDCKCGHCQLVPRDLLDRTLAALASAQPAQAGEYEGLCKRLESDRHMTQADSLSALLVTGREAASAIRTLEARAEAAEARALAAEQRLSALSQPETVREALEALDVERALKAFAFETGYVWGSSGVDWESLREGMRKALASLRERPTDGWVLVPKHALEWLNGEGESFEPAPGQRGAYWWRSEFRRRCALPAPPRTGEVG